ncbi:MAG: tail fiber domain-containing protein [Acinetobacter sp.]
MSNINKAAVLNPFSDLTANILNYVPRATTSEFGIVAIGSGINVDALGRIYLDTQEYSDRLTAIEAQVASTLATQKSEVAAAIAQVNLTQSQTITALTLEVSNLKTNLTSSITATQTDLIKRADQLAQGVTDITVQLTQDKAVFTQKIQDALDYLKDDASVASALRTPRKINGTDFDGRSDITTNAWGAARTFKIGNKTNSINGTSNVAYSLADIGAFPDVGGTIQGNVEVTGNLSVGGTISATLEGTAARADKLQVARKIQGVDFDGTKDINLPTFTTQTDGLAPKRVGATTTKYLREDGTWVVPPDTTYALLTAANAEAGTATSANSISAKVLKDAIKFHAPPATDITGNAGTATKLQTPRTINGVLFDGTQNISLPEEAPYSLPTASDSVLGGIKVGSGLAIANSVLSVGTLNQSTTGNAATATKLTTARTIGGVSFDGSANISLPGVNTAGNQSTSGNAASATKLQTARNINGMSFDGTSDITIADSTKLPLTGGTLTGALNLANGTWNTVGDDSQFGDVDLGGILGIRSNNEAAYVGLGFYMMGAHKTAPTAVFKVRSNGEADLNVPLNCFSFKGNATSATKLETARTINGVSFDGSANITLPLASTSVSGTVQLDNTLVSTATDRALTAAQGRVLNDSKLAKTENAVSASKLATARMISLTGAVTGSVSFDGSANASIATSITGLGVANGIATLDSNGQVPSTQLPSYVDDVLEYTNVAAFPTTGVAGKIYVETTGNTTYRWGGTAYVKITSGEVSSVAGKSGVVTLTKSDVGLPNVDNTADSTKSVASAAKLTTARTIGGVSFDGTANISLPGVNTPGNQNTSGNAATTTKLQTARTIAISGAVTGTATSFDGTSDIAIATTALDGSKISTGTIPAARIPTLNQSTTGNAATATKLANARTINGVAFDGTANITVEDSTKLPLAGGTLSGDLSVTGAITATGNITAFSDARIKGDLLEIEDSVSKVQSLTGYTYTRTDLNDGLRYVGLIAQDVQAVVPEAVREYEDGALSVDYMGLVGLLVQAIKEQDKRIKDLEEA